MTTKSFYDYIKMRFSDEKIAEIERRAQLAAEENPDLNHDLIKSILIAKQEVKAGKLDPYDLVRSL